MLKKMKYHKTFYFSPNDADVLIKILENCGFVIHRFKVNTNLDGFSVYEEIQ